MFPLSRSVSHPLTVSGHHVRFVLHQAGYLVERDKCSFSSEPLTRHLVLDVSFFFFPLNLLCSLMPPATLLIYFLTFLSGRRKQPHLANQRHVPAIRGGQRPGAAPGRQEAQIQHQDQEQQLVTKVQRNIPIVSSLVSYVLDTQAHSARTHTHSIHLHTQPRLAVGSVLHSVDYLYTTTESCCTLYKV